MVSIADKDTELYVQFFTPKKPKSINISSRMSWYISEILKPLKKLAVVYYQVYNLSASPWVFKPDNTPLLVF